MGAAGAPRTVAVVASVALAAVVATGCEPISTVGMPPSVGQKASKSNAKPKPSRTNKAWTIKQQVCCRTEAMARSCACFSLARRS